MNNKIDFPTQLRTQCCCPNCRANVSEGFNLEQLFCNRCKSEFFTMENIPCLFPAGTHQRLIWQHQTAMLTSLAEQALNNIRESLARYDLSDTTRERLAEIYKANLINRDSIQSLLAKKSVPPEFNETLNQMHAGDLSEYFDLIFRDWAWDTVSEPSEENKNALKRITSLIDTLPNSPKRVLVLGAGAGRLSWDIHTYLDPEFSLVVDSNPLLLAVADELIKQKNSLTFGEFKLFPQIDFPTTATRNIPSPQVPVHQSSNWFLLAANVWNLPLPTQSFDLIITPWFIDVNGGDVRDLIGLIQNLLTPEGSWLNTGPLLYTRHLPTQLKYSQTEIKEFFSLGGLSLTSERIDQAPYLVSPMEARIRTEQIWSFVATQTAHTQPVAGVIANWLIMHHLPIPVDNYRSSQSHPLIDAIIQMVDGKKSINTISAILDPQMPEGVMVKEVVVAILGQLVLDTRAAEDMSNPE